MEKALMTAEDSHDSTIDELLAGYVDRLNCGEMLDREEIQREHPEEAAALLERLEVFQAFGQMAQTSTPVTGVRRSGRVHRAGV